MNRNNANRLKKTKVISSKTIESKNRSGSAQPRRKVNVEVKNKNNKTVLHVERNHSKDRYADNYNTSNKKEEKKQNSNKKNTKIKTLGNSSKKNTISSTMKTKKDKEKNVKKYNKNTTKLEAKIRVKEKG